MEEAEGGGWVLVLTRRQAGERIAGSEPASQLRVMQQGPWVGLASDAAGGRYLQVRRRGSRGQRPKKWDRS